MTRREYVIEECRGEVDFFQKNSQSVVCLELMDSSTSWVEVLFLDFDESLSTWGQVHKVKTSHQIRSCVIHTRPPIKRMCA